MKTPNQNNPGFRWVGLQSSGPAKLCFLAALVFLWGASVAPAANVYLKANDALGSSSITGSANWNPAGVPVAGNMYFTTNTAGVGFQMRTPTGLANNLFPGDALVLCTNLVSGSVSILIKSDQGSTLTVNNLVLAGGGVGNGASAGNANTTNSIAGMINVVANSRFDSGGAGRGIIVAAAITNGVSTITNQNAGTIWMFGTNYGFTGKMAVISGCTLRITNQFNLGGNPAAFTADQLLLDNGTLQVTNDVSLNDANRGVTVSINNGRFDVASGATLTIADPITGAGTLTKINPGTLILSGANTYTNVTVVNGGILSIQNSSGLGTNGTVNQASGGRNSTVQLQGGVSIPPGVNFTLSNDGITAPFTNAIENISGNNTINGTITLTQGGGSSVIQSDSGALLLAGNVRIATGQTSRGIILQGASTAANTVAGTILDLSPTSVNSVTKTGNGTWTLSGTNTYTGPTTISGGTLVVSGSGSISNTAVISIASGTTFDVSGLSSTFTLGAGQSISNSTGTVIGSVATTAGSSICPSSAGVAGTLTFNNNLNLSAGGLAYLDVSTVFNSDNDQIVVGGNLTLSSSDTIHLNALGGSAPLDQTGDYILFAVSGTTTMATSPSLVWDGTQPANTANFSIKKVGNNVVLSYSASTAPSVPTASVSPTPAVRNQAVTVTANVTKGSATVASVTVDLTQIGGSSAASLVLDGANSSDPNFVYTNTFVVAASATLGDKSLNVIATDTSSPTPLSGNFIITPLTIIADAVTWDGGGADDKWGSDANWAADMGPGFIGDNVTFAGTTRLTPDLNTNYSVTSLTFDGSAGAFTINSSTGSTLTNSGGILNNSASTQTLNVPVVLSAAQIFSAAAGNLTLNSNLTLGGNTLTVDSAANTTIAGVISGTAGLTKVGGGTLVLPNANTYGNNGASDTLVNGGTLSIGNDLALGTSRLNFGEGSTVQSADSSARLITNTINFGGSTTFAGTGNLKFTRGAANGTPKTMTVNNPVTEFSGVLSGAMSRTVAGTGLLIFSAANTYSQGTTINPGATLQLGTGGTNGSLSTSGVIDVEGTLIFNRSDAVVQGTHFSSTPIIGGGGVVQAGSGTTTLNAANTYSGPTTVNNGELIITPGYQSGSAVFVANNAKFGISASSVSNSAIIGNLTLGSGGATTLDFSFGFAGNPTNAALAASAVTISGTSSIRVGGSFAVGVFPVLKYSSLSGSFASTVTGPRGVTATLSNDVVNQIIYVKIASIGTGIVWTGTNSVSPNLWDLNTTTNWLIGGVPTVYIETVPPGDAVTFNDSGSGTVLLSNTISPSSVTINNTVVNYTFQGSGQIISAAGLSKVGPGTVTLNVPGTFGGSTVVSNGTLNLGANQTFANLSGNSAVIASTGSPTITINESLNTAFSGGISGLSTLTKSGTAELTLTGSSSLTTSLFVKAGGLTLDSGTISANNFCSIGQNGTDNGTMTLKGTATFTGNNDLNVGDVVGSVGTLNIQDTASLTVSSFYIGSANGAGSTASGTVNQTGGVVTQTSTGTGTFAVGGRTEATSIGGVGVYNMIGGVLNATTAIRLGGGGTGTFNQSGGTVNVGVDVNLARFAGSVGTYNLDGGTLRTARVTSSTAANCTLNLNGGVLLAREDNTSIITNIATVNVRNGGAVIDTTNFNVSIGSALQHSTIGGDNATDGGLTKRGNGTLSLGGTGTTYTGPTLVTAGALNCASGSIASLNTLTVSNAALGLAMNYGSGSFNAASLKLAGNSALNVNYDLVLSGPATALVVSGGITVSGSTVINLTGYGFTVGQFALVSYTGTPLPNLNNFSLGALPVGVTANLSNNVANSSIDLVITAVGISSWVPLANTDALGTSSFNSGGNWMDFTAPSAANGYFTRAFILRSPADTSSYDFGGAALSVDAGGQLLLKGINGQVITVSNLFLNGGIVVFGVSVFDNFMETLGGTMTLQSGTTSTLAANGGGSPAETLTVTAPIGGGGNLQINGISGDVGTIVLASTNTYTGTTTVATGTLLVNGVNGNTGTVVSTNATLGGIGIIGGSVTVQAGGTLAPGIPSRGALTNEIGTLTAGNTTVSGTVLMKIDRGAAPTSDKLTAPSVVINAGASLTVNNIGATNLVAGDTFTLFSTPVSGTFGTVNLPPLPDTTVAWTNKLAVNGTIAIISVTTINTNSPVVTNSVSGGNLTMSWAADHTGWTLQVQTNSLGQGLGTNWVDVPGSTSVNTISIPITTTNGTVFYRLKL